MLLHYKHLIFFWYVTVVHECGGKTNNVSLLATSTNHTLI